MTETNYDYLIVGGGMVADAAARGIRELDGRGSIGILSADVDPPYTRPALTKKLWTDPDFSWDQVPLGTVDDTGAELRLETLVTGIDRDHREVSLESGETVGYDRLLLATGGVPHRVDAPDDDRVVVFRSAADYGRLRRLAVDGTHAVVIGGGFIGGELAAGLVQNDVRVTLVHPDDTLGGSMFPPGLAATYEELFARHGVDVRGGLRAERVRAASDTLVVELDDGTPLGADVVVVGLGISPAVELAERAGLAVEDGVRVDERLRTTDERIWAAGDIALYPDAILGPVRVEHVDNARAMGHAVGRSMAGDERPFEYTPYFYSVVFGIRWEAVGQLDPRLDTVEDWLEPGERGVFYFLDGEAPVGVLMWNLPGLVDAARAVLADPPRSRDELVGRIRPDAAPTPSGDPAFDALVARLGDDEEVSIVTRADDGRDKPTRIWSVVVDGVPYVRSAFGPESWWYRRAIGRDAAAFRTDDGTTTEVRLARVHDDAVESGVDGALTAKYGRFERELRPMLSDVARGTTLRVLPA